MPTANITDTSACYTRGAQVHKMVQSIEITKTESETAGAVFPICEIPQDAIITGVKVINDDVDTGTDLLIDVGIYSGKIADLDVTSVTDLTVKDQDILCIDSTVLQAATAVKQDILGFGLGTAGPTNLVKKIWELAGDTISTRALKYILALTIATAAGTGAAGSIFVEVEYIQG